MSMRTIGIASALACVCFVGACLALIPVVHAGEEKTIIVQSTTSTQNSGLFDYILPQFKKQSGITVNVVAVGTGTGVEERS